MGEDYNASDCSWKKMVIAKANNEWVSTIKTEKIDGDKVIHNSDFRLNHEKMPFSSVKTEMEGMEQALHSLDEPETVMEEMDPLSIDEPSKRRKRKGSGPKNETPEERAMRLAKMSAYAAQRLANETPEQRALRLKRMSEYAAKRLSQETSEQRAKRLARMSAYAAKRLSEETPDQRRVRLARMSAYAAKRQAMKKLMNPGSPQTDYSSSNFNSQVTMPNQS